MNRRTLLRLVGGATLMAMVNAAGAFAQARPHAAYDALLQRYVKAQPDGVNRVDYATWKASKADLQGLNDYLEKAAKLTPSKMPRNAAFAYWANLYNAITLKVILDRFPVTSIRDIKSDGFLDPKAYIGPWRSKRVTVEGKSLSLDDIENDIMRPAFKDPRVHYSVNCASFGCPNLPAKAWDAATLDAELDSAARDFVNHPRGVTVQAGGKLKVSSIYKWFRDDFGSDDAAVIAHLKKFAKPELLATLDKATIGEDGYDWSLNGLGAKGK